MNLLRPLPPCRSDAVATGVPPADDDDDLAPCIDSFVLTKLLPGIHTVLLCEVLHCKVNVPQVSTGNGQIARGARTDGEADGFKFLTEVFRGDILPHGDGGLKPHAVCRQLLQPTIDQELVQLEVGVRVAERR